MASLNRRQEICKFQKIDETSCFLPVACRQLLRRDCRSILTIFIAPSVTSVVNLYLEEFLPIYKTSLSSPQFNLHADDSTGRLTEIRDHGKSLNNFFAQTYFVKCCVRCDVCVYVLCDIHQSKSIFQLLVGFYSWILFSLDAIFHATLVNPTVFFNCRLDFTLRLHPWISFFHLLYMFYMCFVFTTEIVCHSDRLW